MHGKFQSNSLVNETSPYLLQHANNPVNWYPWELGLKKAKIEKKPIFISIGYAACHWCHVMEKESFSDPDTASIMNELFINIKIDREERPDLDSYYQKAVSLLTGRSGGWPLSVFATPRGEPFSGGTYFPKKQSYNLPSFIKVLKYVHSEYQKDPEQIHKVTQRINNSLKSNFTKVSTSSPMSIRSVIDSSLGHLIDTFDNIFGGFGIQPKFPQVSDLRFILLSYYRRKNQKLLDFVVTTLDKMSAGGIYDHLGFGFHRYSVDRKWLIPHFEKMLYDNAQLLLIFLEVFQITQNRKYAKTAKEIIQYLKREMIHEEGGFFSSQDADSEDEEGKFFVWTLDEIYQILGKEAGEKFSKHFNVTEEGNFEKGFSILHKATQDTLDSSEEINEFKNKLFSHRENREKPFLNDNIILSWNALLIHSLARASFILDSPEYLEIGEKAIEFILNRLVEKETNRLFRHYRGKAKTFAFAEDYALFINALIETFAISGKKAYLDKAIELQRIYDDNFWDITNNGYYFSGKWQNEISFIEKPVVTFSLPSPNAVSLENLLKIYHYSGENQYLEKADKLANFLAIWYKDQGYLGGDSLIALDMYDYKPLEIVLFTKMENESSTVLLHHLQKIYLPNTVFLNVNENSVQNLNELYIIEDKISDQNLEDLMNGTTFICKDLTCSVPIKNPRELDLHLQELNIII